jgi:hypothetical protein
LGVRRRGSRKAHQQPRQARALLRQELKDGPKPGALVEAAAAAAALPERSLIRAADALGVRTQRGQWWLPTRKSPLQSATKTFPRERLPPVLICCAPGAGQIGFTGFTGFVGFVGFVGQFAQTLQGVPFRAIPCHCALFR